MLDLTTLSEREKQKPWRPGSHLVLSEAVMDTNLGGGKGGSLRSATREDMDLTLKSADKTAILFMTYSTVNTPQGDTFER